MSLRASIKKTTARTTTITAIHIGASRRLQGSGDPDGLTWYRDPPKTRSETAAGMAPLYEAAWQSGHCGSRLA